jgi:ABC-type Fe3+ transport system permease subunit
MKTAGLLALHIICLYFLRLLWTDRKEAARRGGLLTKMGYISRKKSPRLFQFSLWVDFVFLAILYVFLIVYSVWFALP